MPFCCFIRKVQSKQNKSKKFLCIIFFLSNSTKHNNHYSSLKKCNPVHFPKEKFGLFLVLKTQETSTLVQNQKATLIRAKCSAEIYMAPQRHCFINKLTISYLCFPKNVHFSWLSSTHFSIHLKRQDHAYHVI